jgi:HlyD family secretion protein
VTIKPITTNQEIAGTITHVNKLPDQAEATSQAGTAGGSSTSSVSNLDGPADNHIQKPLPRS